MLTAIMHKTLEELRQGFNATLEGFSENETQRRSRPESWSVQQIVEHLLLTYRLTAENFETRLAKGTPTAAKPTLANRMGQFYLCTLGLFPKGRKSPAIVEPPLASEPVSGKTLAVQAQTALERFDSAAEAAEQLFGNQPAIVHPILGPMSVQHWRRFHLIHGQHHLRQVQALRSN